MPRIAISVDLMDTGIDVPEVVNLVFMKPVQSQIKLTQMIGRGTRSQETCKHLEWLPEGKKEKFLIIDFWQNKFDREPKDDVVNQDLPVLVKIFNTRLKLLECYLKDQALPEREQVIADARSQIAKIPLDAFSVQKVYADIELAWTEGFWLHLTQTKINFLRSKVGPLLRFVAGTDVAAATFTNKVERLKHEILTNVVKDSSLESIAEDISRLPDFVLQDPQKQASVNTCLSAQLRSATPAALNQVIHDLADQMRNRREKPNAFLELDLKDTLASSGYITLGEGGEEVYVQEYRERVERKVLEIVENHPTIAALRSGEPVTDLQLVALERTLKQELGGRDIQLTTGNIRKAFNLKVGSLLAFLRQQFEMDEVDPQD